MKTLYLLRHAHTLPAGPEGDKARKLSPQGEMDARALGRVMAEKQYRPTYILCSPATRTRQTLACVLESLGEIETDFPELIYERSTGDILHAIHGVPGDYSGLLVVAHNPSIHQLAAMLAGSGDDAVLRRLRTEGYSPCTLTVLSCPVESWAEIKPGENELRDFLEAADFNAP